MLRTGPVYDFASFIILFNDIFVKDRYYQNFNMINDMEISNEIGRGAQFIAQLLRLPPGTSVRTSEDPLSRLTQGATVVLKSPRLFDSNGDFVERDVIRNITTELRVLTHPGLREHSRTLDVYGFAWDVHVTDSATSVWPVIMVEYGELGTIRQYVSRKQTLGLDAKLILASDIAHALHVLHQNGIVHSDLKPGNVLVCKNADGRPVAKLADFGLAIFIEAHDQQSLWKQGTYPWMAPEHKTRLTREELLKTDLYSCGLVLWSILLDGAEPWTLPAFEGDDREASFQRAKATPARLVDIALDSVRSAGAVPTSRLDEIRDIFQALLTTPNRRSLDLLLAYQPHLSLAQTPVAVHPQLPNDVSGRPMFQNFDELQDLPLKLQREILLAFNTISTSPHERPDRQWEAHYATAIMTLLRIGTVVQRDSASTEYIGYDIDATEVLCQLRAAATTSHGSPMAQAMYHRVSKALAAGSAASVNLSANIRNAPAEDLVPRSTVISWLKRATVLGSHVASSTLRRLDPDTWYAAASLFRTDYCGVGRQVHGDAGLWYQRLQSTSIPSLSMSGSVGQYGDSILHVAATLGRLEVVEHLTDGISPEKLNNQNVRGETALLQAARSGHYAITERLLSVGANAAILTDNNESPLHWLCAFPDEENRLMMLAVSMIESGAEIDGICSPSTIFNEHFQDSLGGGTPLCRAVQRDSYIACRVLMMLGADPYKDRGGGEDQYRAPHAAALACCAHNLRILQLFLTSDTPIQPPKWYGLPGIFDPEHTFEVIKARWKGAPTYQSAAPQAWQSMKERTNHSSLLGYAVNPDPLHERMALLGETYLEQMQKVIDLLAHSETQEFDRVTADYESALLRSVLSRDVSLVSHLLLSYPEQTAPSLINPVPTGLSMRLPVQLALSKGDKPIFDILLRHAGPNTAISAMHMKGITDNRFAQAVSWLTTRASTIASAKVSRNFKNAVHLAAAAHPDSHFMRALLSGIPAADARRLVNSHGTVGDQIPLMVALANHHFDTAAVLLEYGADIEEEAANITGKSGLGFTPLGLVIYLNNNGTLEAVSWLLRHGAALIVNRKQGRTAISAAVRAGASYEVTEPESPLPARLWDGPRSHPVLQRLLDHYSSSEQINQRMGGMWNSTALHWAVLRLDADAVRMLLLAGADASAIIDFPARSLSAWELAALLDEDDIPPEVHERGRDEVEEYVRRMEQVGRMFSLVNADPDTDANHTTSPPGSASG